MAAMVSSGFVGFLAYLLLAGSLSTSELITGVVLGLGVSSWTVLGRRVATRRFAFSMAHARAGGRAIRQLPRQTLTTCGFLLRAAIDRTAPQGKAAVRRFEHGAVDDPAARGRRATAVLAASLAPASYVVRMAPGDDGVLIHSVGVTSNTDPRWLA